MKCPIDQTEMEKGSLATHGIKWVNKLSIAGKFMVSLTNNPVVRAYKCPKCGKIELYTETETK